MATPEKTGWKEELRRECLRLKEQGQIVSDTWYEGIIAHKPEMTCPKGHCGVYLGIELYGGYTYLSVNANYCPFCDQVWLIKKVRPAISTTPPESFLPILKSRVLKLEMIPNPATTPCPKCGRPTFSEVELAGIATFQLVKWTVCTNPDNCDWPGECNCVN